MTIKDFYKNYKDILVDKVTILENNHIVYENFLRDQKPLECLMDITINSIYIGEDYTLVVEIEA